MSRSGKYSRGQRNLHWLIAVIVISALTLGLVIDNYGFDGLMKAFGQDTTNLIYKYHKTLGVLVLMTMVVRIAFRLKRGAPRYAQPLPLLIRLASSAAHLLLYALLVLVPVLGWLATGAGGFPVEFFNANLPALLEKNKELSETLYGAHGFAAKLLLITVLVHIAGALWHGLIRRDGVLQRML